MNLIRNFLYAVLALLSAALAARSAEPPFDSVNWTTWTWTAPEPALPSTEWYDYGWDSTSNGPVPAELGQRAARRAVPGTIQVASLRGGQVAPGAGAGTQGTQGTKAPPAPPAVAAAADEAPYRAGQFTVSPFTAWSTPNLKLDRVRQHAGLSLGYHVARNIEVSAEVGADDTDERAIDQLGAHGRGYLPLWKSGFAFYGEVGWQRFTGEDDRDFLSTGVGVALRSKRAGARAGLRKLDDFKRGDLLQLVVAAEVRF